MIGEITRLLAPWAPVDFENNMPGIWGGKKETIGSECMSMSCELVFPAAAGWILAFCRKAIILSGPLITRRNGKHLQT